MYICIWVYVRCVCVCVCVCVCLHPHHVWEFTSNTQPQLLPQGKMLGCNCVLDNSLRAPFLNSISSLLLCVLSHFSPVWLFVTPWTVAHQAPLSMGLSRQEYESGLPCPPPGDLLNPRDWTYVSYISYTWETLSFSWINLKLCIFERPNFKQMPWGKLNKHHGQRFWAAPLLSATPQLPTHHVAYWLRCVEAR